MNKGLKPHLLFDFNQQQNLFRRLIRAENLLDNPGKGDCFFYSIINNIDKERLNNISMVELRYLVSIMLKNLKNNRENRLYKYIEGIENYDEYCEWIIKQGNWNNGNNYSNFELILSLLSEEYDIDIVVLVKFKKNKNDITNDIIHSYLYSSNNSEGKRNNRIIIYYNESSQHYQTIIRDKFINSISINNFIEIVE